MLRRLLLVGVATSAFACGASAADLPAAPGPSYYPGAVTPVPYYDWTGIYLGANVGGAWASQSGSVTTDDPTATVVAVTSSSSTGFAGGGQIGANWFIVPSFVLGIEGDFDALTNRTSVTSSDGTNKHDGTLRFLSTARGRFGLTADRFMFYLTGGLAWGQDQVTLTQIAGTVNNAVPGTVESITSTKLGWTAGTGIEYGFARNWTARLEYLYAHLDGDTYTFPLAERSTMVPFQAVSELRIGVNYKFDWGGPIATRD